MVTSSQREEQEEICRLLKTNGVSSELYGSIHKDVLVPKDQLGIALALLKTNRLVTTGKIVLQRQ